ncbi:hypothetical protein [Stenotrophomonas maltophilia]|jgi:hypothetical protein|uniref:hypothetical protein n=1 Tax=Stenotrophomonas maltophilia group TaxID=995085 RepID=UPI00038FC0D4|nr:hypothetical protein [Stenotrophomonas maltophilia]EQM87400.1 hypothetical protein L681_04400 [Stenotrophomonas maltophilia MF89]QNG80157.1 hypothetical protein FLFIOBJN_00132 [Stenotrophomonas maltophilia]CRX67690.1 unnamed protein product [Stenotrophomonas maltophilia]HEL3758590.1 hypothetical protein [Stenotrophomonas maltophilia]
MLDTASKSLDATASDASFWHEAAVRFNRGEGDSVRPVADETSGDVEHYWS